MTPVVFDRERGLPPASPPVSIAPDPYDPIAAYYDLGMAGFDDDVGLYLGLARRTGGRILELGCGTGRLVEALTDDGFQVLGVDQSAAMLAQARRRLEHQDRRASLVRASICRIPLRGRFSLVILALGTFLHLLDLEQQRACLRAARSVLKGDGLLVLDLPAPAAPGWDDWSPGARPLVPAWSARLVDGSRIDKLSTFCANASTQTHHVTEFYERTSPAGAVERTVAEYDLRFVFPAELELLLASAGLKLMDRYGGYDLGPFDAASARQICVAGPAAR